MARKIPVPLEEEDLPDDLSPDRQPTSQQRSPTSSDGCSPSGGAIPRRREPARYNSNNSNGSFRRNPGGNDQQDGTRQRRRRLDSLNLETSSSPPDRSAMDSWFDWLPTDPSSHLRSLVPPYQSHILAQETESEGQELYLHFLHERLRYERLVEVEIGLEEYHDHSAHLGGAEEEVERRIRRRRMSMNLQNFQNPLWRQTGRDLQALADDFARSHEREMVRIRAEQVDVASLDMNKFMALLNELFQGGTNITRERILVLFFFSSDVAIRAVRCKLEGFMANLTKWTLQFIKEKVCSWVHERGGWQAVLHSGLNLVQQMAVIGMCAAVMTACVVYVKKCLHK